VVQVGNPPANSTHAFEYFFGHVAPLPVMKPSPSNFSISNNLTEQSSETCTVGRLLATRNRKSIAWSKPPKNKMLVYFGPWTEPYSTPLSATFP
jgi:hypothetical protein